jgi:hypothetical protein
MSKLCRITVLAYLFGDIPKGLENGYEDDDLTNAIDYCEALLEEGLVREPMDNFDLQDFIRWAKKTRGY